MEKINLESLLNLESLGQGKATKVLREIDTHFEEQSRSAGFMRKSRRLSGVVGHYCLVCGKHCKSQPDQLLENLVHTL